MTERADDRACAHALVALAFCLLASCDGPTRPIAPDGQTAPIIRSLSVPASHVEAGTEIAISAAVEDSETPLNSLTFHWSASAGTITGNGLSATWRMPAGITSGVTVFIGLTVVDEYDTVISGRRVKQQFVVSTLSTPFRVHDSAAEVKALARRFLVDLFGNSSVAPEACMVDFAEVCANIGEGKNEELKQIVNHRATVVLTNSQMLNQRHAFFGPDSGSVHTAMLYTGHPTTSSLITSGCGDFELTMVYVGNRWWICESYFHEDDRSFCPSGTGNSQLLQALRKSKTLH